MPTYQNNTTNIKDMIKCTSLFVYEHVLKWPRYYGSAQLWKKYFEFWINFQWQNWLKIQYRFSPYIRKKLQNHLEEISVINGFPIEKAYPNFPKSFNFDFVEFSLTKLFNIQSLLHCLECPLNPKTWQINWLKNVEFMVKVLEGWNLTFTWRYQLVLDGFFFWKETSILGFDTPSLLGSLGVGLSECWAVLIFLRKNLQVIKINKFQTHPVIK